MFWRKFGRSRKAQASKGQSLRERMTRYGRVYIIPTRFGAFYIAGSFLMLVIGAAYSNNLINLLGFFMLALSFTAMIVTHNNIKGVVISKIESIHGFAGEDFSVAMVVRNTLRDRKSNCEFTIRGQKKIAQYDARVSIEPGGEVRLLASFQAPERGVHTLSVFSLSTTAPFGLFKAWQYQSADAQAVIYPKRQGEREWAKSRSMGGNLTLQSTGAEDFKDVRPYRTGDNLKRVDWRAFARGRPLMTKEFEEATGAGLRFDYHLLQDLTFESRLEQLAEWIDVAVQKGLPFELILPGKRMGPDTGLNFAHRGWSELARLENPNDTDQESA